MARNNGMVFAYDAMSRTLAWNFPGTKLPPVEYQHADVGALDSLDVSALVHGFKQKIADSAAISRNPDTGHPASMADKRDAMVKTADNLRNGEWYAERTGGGSVGGVLALAIANVRGKPIDAVRAFLKDKTKEVRDAMAAKPEFADEIARILKARTAGVDVTEDLDAIDDL